MTSIVTMVYLQKIVKRVFIFVNRIKMLWVLYVTLVLALFPFSDQYASAERQAGSATTIINEKQYSYGYCLFLPKKLIEFQKPPVKQNFKTPMDALITMFSYMKNGMVIEWRKMWAEGKGSRFSATDERLREGWKRWLSEPHYLLYELSYKGHVIYVSEREGVGKTSRAKFCFKKVGEEYMLSQNLFKDDFGSILDSPNFDPASGQRVVEPTALYSFESMQEFHEIVDSAKVQLMNTDHSINNAKGITIKKGKGVKGKSIVLDGKGYVLFPPSLPLSLYNNKFTISLWVKVESIPHESDNRIGPDEFASAVLSRGTATSTGYISLEVRERDKAINGSKVFLQVGTGPEALQMSTSIQKKEWTKIEIIYDSISLDMKVNEVIVVQKDEKKSEKSTPRVHSKFDRFMLGRHVQKPFCPFIGSIDELAISNEIVR